jgi:hypothetical protein
MSKPVATQARVVGTHDAAIDAVLEALRGLRYGQLEIHLHDAHVVKIMRTEKIRLFEESATPPHDTSS